MKKTGMALMLGLTALASGSALARGHVDLMIGLPLAPYYPAPYYYPPVYQPPVIVQAPAPQVYVEQPVREAAAPAAGNAWYYCAAAKGYYPYVRECPGGWQKVSPEPQP